MSKIALGTVQFGLDYGVGSANKKTSLMEVKDILHYAKLKGVGLLDTAPAYGDSEEILGKSGVSGFDIVTKTRYFKGSVVSDNDADLMELDLDSSLLKLKLDSVYGMLLHNANDALKTGSDKLFGRFEKLKQQGKVRKIGVSIYDHEQLQSIINNHNIDLVQVPFNILDRRLIDLDMFTTLKKKKVEIHVRSIFLQGLLLMDRENMPCKFHRWNGLWKIWHEWLSDNHLTALEATVRYVNSIEGISKILVGVNSKDHLEGIIDASHGELPDIPVELSTNDILLLNPSYWGEL